MPSLSQLLATQAPLLVLDAASTRIQVGWLAADGSARWEISDEEAGIGIFRCVEKLGTNVSEAGAFVFSDGPGSILGIRTVAMALRTWQLIAPRPIFAYGSLALVGHALGNVNATIISDARRDHWHAFSLRSQQKLRRVPASELSGELVTPENFRSWSPIPTNVSVVGYSVPHLLAQTTACDIFKPIVDPDAFLHEAPNYVSWTPQIHRAPPTR